jgi:DNA-binding PadR family transcriptional regulator
MLKPIALHTLLALADRDNYGYAIMQAIREQSDGHVAVQTASFYRHLSGLLDEGLVAEVAAKRASDDPRRGSYYRITARGKQVLLAEKRRLTALVSQMNKVRLTSGKAHA